MDFGCQRYVGGVCGAGVWMSGLAAEGGLGAYITSGDIFIARADRER